MLSRQKHSTSLKTDWTNIGLTTKRSTTKAASKGQCHSERHTGMEPTLPRPVQVQEQVSKYIQT